MADLRIPPGLPAAPARPVAPARAQAIRAAQRAFFDTALAGETRAAPAASATPVEAIAPAAPSREVRTAVDAGAPPPSRLLRPGSLLDIKV